VQLLELEAIWGTRMEKGESPHGMDAAGSVLAGADVASVAKSLGLLLRSQTHMMTRCRKSLTLTITPREREAQPDEINSESSVLAETHHVTQ
jgi:hypothetical protein